MAAMSPARVMSDTAMEAMAPGEVVEGRYRIVRLLGQGAFGKTYAAKDQQTGQQVAVKQLSLAHLDDWKSVELFEREARILATLSHPRIPDYVEFLPIQSQRSGYLVQTLAPGRSLAAHLDGGRRFDEAETLEVARQVLEILCYLSALSPPVVHRDIKPDNLILDDDGGICLVDFGAVQDAAKETLGGGSTVVGTFGYMAPEQFQGTASPASDLYGLGMTLVHMLSGVEPTSMDKTRLQVDFRKYVQVSPSCQFVLDQLIAPVPEDRFPSAADALAVVNESRPLGQPVAAGSQLEALILARDAEQHDQQRKADLARRQKQARIASKKRGISSALSVTRDGDGNKLEFAPPTGRRLGPHGGLLLGLMSLFFMVAVGACAWAIVARPFIVVMIHALLWGGLGGIASLWGVIHSVQQFRRHRLHLLVSDRGNFAIHHGDPERPRAFGRLAELQLGLHAPGPDRVLGSAYIKAGSFEQQLPMTEEEIDQFKRFADTNAIGYTE